MNFDPDMLHVANITKLYNYEDHIFAANISTIKTIVLCMNFCTYFKRLNGELKLFHFYYLDCSSKILDTLFVVKASSSFLFVSTIY